MKFFTINYYWFSTSLVYVFFLYSTYPQYICIVMWWWIKKVIQSCFKIRLIVFSTHTRATVVVGMMALAASHHAAVQQWIDNWWSYRYHTMLTMESGYSLCDLPLIVLLSVAGNYHMTWSLLTVVAMATKDDTQETFGVQSSFVSLILL